MIRLLATSVLLAACALSQRAPPYYGLPLGAVFFSADSTQGEVYASDPHTLTVVNFYHKAKPGCTTFVAGPPKPNEQLNVVATKEAIMLPVKYRKQTRSRRQAVQRGIQWNVGPAVGSFGQNSAPRSEGIQWGEKSATPAQSQRGQPRVTPQTLPLLPGSGIQWGEEANKNVQARFFGPIPREPSEFIGGINVPDEEEEGKDVFTVQRKVSTEAPGPDEIGPDGIKLRFGIAPPKPPAPIVTEPPKPELFAGLPPSALKAQAPGSPAPPAPAAVKKPKEEVRGELGGFVLLPSNASRLDYFLRNESKLLGEEEVPAENQPVVNQILEQSAADGKNDTNALWRVIQDPRRRTYPPIVEASTVASANDNGGHEWVVVDDPRLRRPAIPPSNLIAINSPVQTAEEESKLLNQPLFVPVEDRKALFEAPIPISVDSTPDPVSLEINGSPKLPASGDGLFYVLPEISGEDLTVVLPESYDLTQFQWFGVYDHCKRQRTATVSIRNVAPPKETEIDGFQGWQHDVKSQKIHILNCNTMLISNFTYSGAGKTDAYIYVGNGDFPRSIIQKARAYIVGTQPDRVLQNYRSEDVLVRLPPGWKTLDISWISVYNPRENISYGHALVPPVVAPPCDE